MFASLGLLMVMIVDDPTRAGMVRLDFHQQSLPEIVRQIGDRGGNPLNLHFAEVGAEPPKFTLEASEAVPFWEAIDRLSRVVGLQCQVNEGGGWGNPAWNVSMYGPAEADPSVGVYAGPFRFGHFQILTDTERAFVIPQQTGLGQNLQGCRAEIAVMVEPRVLAIRTGPLEDLAAIDDLGLSLIDPVMNKAETAPEPNGGYYFNTFPHVLRIRLKPPDPTSRRLQHLRGRMPVEVGLLPQEPSRRIDLKTSIDRPVIVDDLEVTVKEYAPQPDGAVSVVIEAKILGARGDASRSSEAVVRARSNALLRQFQMVDTDGHLVLPASGGTSNSQGWRLEARFPAPNPRGVSAPTHLLLYLPRWSSWSAPFEFRDVPLTSP